jgi:predicted polyphosphate/ATP-dependent NAD kinase
MKVGIIANPVSARDIRRVVSFAANLPVNDRANIVLRILAGLRQAGVNEIVMMPENGGIRVHMMRAISRDQRMGTSRFPAVRFLDMRVTGTAEDSAEAARRMRAEGVGAIVVLGGDGTSRMVVANCGNTPIAAVSTGTNNAFPLNFEPTVTGLAVGLAVTGALPGDIAFSDNKRIDVTVNEHRLVSLVDLVVLSDRFVGSRAVWKTESLRDVFAAYSAPHLIGMSSIAGLLMPSSRNAPYGTHVRMQAPSIARTRLSVPLAPGLFEEVGVEEISRMEPDVTYRPSVSAGVLAFDGEREVTFTESDEVRIRLRPEAFRTLDIPACLAFASSARLFTRRACAADAQKDQKRGGE